MRYLLDTNTCISAMRHEPAVVRRLESVAPDDCVISSITGYELFTGVAKCSNASREAAKVQALLHAVHVLPFDLTAAQRAAAVRADIESRGCPIGPYDVLLAGHAIATGLTLVSANTTEFNRVAGLLLEDWSK